MGQALPDMAKSRFTMEILIFFRSAIYKIEVIKIVGEDAAHNGHLCQDFSGRVLVIAKFKKKFFK